MELLPVFLHSFRITFRLLRAASHIRIMIDPEGAVENEIQKNFESKCDAVLNIEPLEG